MTNSCSTAFLMFMRIDQLVFNSFSYVHEDWQTCSTVQLHHSYFIKSRRMRINQLVFNRIDQLVQQFTFITDSIKSTRMRIDQLVFIFYSYVHVFDKSASNYSQCKCFPQLLSPVKPSGISFSSTNWATSMIGSD